VRVRLERLTTLSSAFPRLLFALLEAKPQLISISTQTIAFPPLSQCPRVNMGSTRYALGSNFETPIDPTAEAADSARNLVHLFRYETSEVGVEGPAPLPPRHFHPALLNNQERPDHQNDACDTHASELSAELNVITCAGVPERVD
jgi:hypothetical protein